MTLRKSIGLIILSGIIVIGIISPVYAGEISGNIIDSEGPIPPVQENTETENCFLSEREIFYSLADYVMQMGTVSGNTPIKKDDFEEYRIICDADSNTPLSIGEQNGNSFRNTVMFTYRHNLSKQKKCKDEVVISYCKQDNIWNNTVTFTLTPDMTSASPVVWSENVQPKKNYGVICNKVYASLEQKFPGINDRFGELNQVFLGNMTMVPYRKSSTNYMLTDYTYFKNIIVTKRGSWDYLDIEKFNYAGLDFSDTYLRTQAEVTYKEAYKVISDTLKVILGKEKINLCDLACHHKSGDAGSAYSINYELNGGKCLSDLLIRYPTNKKSYTLPSSGKMKKTGYRFVGWKDDSGEIIRTINKDSSSGILNLSAIWIPNRYTIVFRMTKPQKGITPPKVSSISADYEDIITLPDNVSASSEDGKNYWVGEWKTRKGISYDAGECVTGVLGLRDKQKIILYPVWEKVEPHIIIRD